MAVVVNVSRVFFCVMVVHIYLSQAVREYNTGDNRSH